MTNTPLSSGEQSKVMIFILFLLPTIFLFVGIIPAIFLAFGIFMMRKSADFSHVETAVRNFRVYVGLAILICSLFALYFATTLGAEDRYEREEEAFIVNSILLSIAVFYFFISKKLFLNPLQEHREWVANNGIFSSKAKPMARDGETREINIIRGEKFHSFSVADELLKWAKLKEDGHITEQQYDEARRKLLQGN